MSCVIFAPELAEHGLTSYPTLVINALALDDTRPVHQSCGGNRGRTSSCLKSFLVHDGSDHMQKYMPREENRRWPEQLWIVRHGQSAGNVARDTADASGLHSIDIAERDVDVPLSALGKQQAGALGNWFADMEGERRPCTVLCSPYVRAQQTVGLIQRAGGLQERAQIHTDERLREREFGILDGLTSIGIAHRHPEQADARARVGKFYHRPPGGESWCDVILRLRSVLDTMSLHHSGPGSRVLIVAHQVVVLCFRYLLENLTESQILDIDRERDVANCGVTSYKLQSPRNARSSDEAQLQLASYNFTAPLVESGAPVTTQPDKPVAPR
jgi:2,3-bisphosphoglycerate-dependent phosphoglycerate mutase